MWWYCGFSLQCSFISINVPFPPSICHRNEEDCSNESLGVLTTCVAIAAAVILQICLLDQCTVAVSTCAKLVGFRCSIKRNNVNYPSLPRIIRMERYCEKTKKRIALHARSFKFLQVLVPWLEVAIGIQYAPAFYIPRRRTYLPNCSLIIPWISDDVT